MPDVYEQFEKDFARVSSYAIAESGKNVAGVSFKLPKDGAGRVVCYLRVWGFPLLRGSAGGYGYDKVSAAFSSALQSRKPSDTDRKFDPAASNHMATMQAVSDAPEASGWSRALRDIGYDVYQVL